MAHKPDPTDNGFSNYSGPIKPNVQKLVPNQAAHEAATARAHEELLRLEREKHEDHPPLV